MQKKIKLVLFDCDGVLVDSEIISNREAAKLKTEMGLPTTTEENIRQFCGLGPTSPEMVELRKKLPPEYPGILKARQAAAYQAELKAISGVRELIQGLKIPFAVVSSSQTEKIELMLRLTGLYNYFEGKIFSGQMVARTKPFPDIYLHAAKNLNTEPADCLAIEDSVPGAQSALSAGMQVVGFTGGQHILPEHEQNLRDVGVNEVFSRMSEIQAWIQKTTQVQ